jgi:tRNA U34 5-methylaminomethyl-2-thiouridine-forming methyltransferase MnmC
VAAERLAYLVAASFPRAELTSLAAGQIRYRTALGSTLAALPTNRDRAKVILDAIKMDEVAIFTDWSDRAAVARIAQLLRKPREQLEDICDHVHRAFRRYYRQRNLVLHWGKTNPVALRACLRTGTPLLAAGVDRVAHAWFVDGMDPVRLSQQARSRIERSQHSGREITDLLESLLQ